MYPERLYAVDGGTVGSSSIAVAPEVSPGIPPPEVVPPVVVAVLSWTPNCSGVSVTAPLPTPPAPNVSIIGVGVPSSGY